MVGTAKTVPVLNSTQKRVNLEPVYELANEGSAKAEFRKKAALELNLHAFFYEFQRRITRVSQTVNAFLDEITCLQARSR